jgi:hypothetical protein
LKWQPKFLGLKTPAGERRKNAEERLKLFQQHQPYRQKPGG